MAENDKALIRLRDMPLALSLLSRLAVPLRRFDRGARAAWAYPLAGLVLGGMAALGGIAALALGLPTPVAALVSLSLQVVLTGAMHEDGLADTADGLWGGWTPARRLEIMKDSHIGSYGVIALILSLGARGVALWLLFEVSPALATSAILAAALLSRAMMPLVMCALPHARASGLSQAQGRAPRATATVGLALAVGLALVLVGAAGLNALVAAAVATCALGLIARAKIGGQTGDILGATQQLAEIAVLFSLLM
ncbi:Adenosylcobinamide-GDP ribazoletransferase [Roseovarius sp. EC-HK134]|uniref:Adenosylcobinamide-GDP ribazoletransferase n=1 Tax=Roseovarius mucosus TaxID=215743 RepID=A0A1V0RLF7_9RHOB|nr:MULTISPECIES: adenosylcobinamide-GDP ribazoletransferase [Roseovarius]ARE82619.1 adenosylcobinamide-GDP ribazoletransferase [Roseovarius mucosus]VVT21898.1 Adenosylcobinamide-GDP ribazoletransferase [Roseovarius sp. EC-SD190]VVT22492.1 Adenosylcobinamide-GDP ribazoletransferase [Roseovarius sp. EC-HK134]